MSLYCSVCRHIVPDGFNQCVHCNAGFTPQLACQICGELVPRGALACQSSQCSPRSLARQEITLAPLPSAPPALPGLPAHVRAVVVPERYKAGRFGVEAVVTLAPGDAETLTLMGQLVVVLHTAAERMNHLAHSESLRKLIKNCRVLAADVQEEMEIRRGPGG